MNLDNLNLVELNAKEAEEVQGGFLFAALVIGIFIGILFAGGTVEVS